MVAVVLVTGLAVCGATPAFLFAGERRFADAFPAARADALLIPLTCRCHSAMDGWAHWLAYGAAVNHMTRLKHLLEQRQGELFYASVSGHPAEVVADLRKRVEALERAYADAIAVMGRATR
jgi:hypothetical protein